MRPTPASATALATGVRPKSRDDTPLEARNRAEGWIREHFAAEGLELSAIGLMHVAGPIVRFVVQTREAQPRSFQGTLDVLRGRVDDVEPERG